MGMSPHLHVLDVNVVTGDSLLLRLQDEISVFETAVHLPPRHQIRENSEKREVHAETAASRDHAAQLTR